MSVNPNLVLGNKYFSWKRAKARLSWRLSLMLRISSTMNFFYKGVM
jgi:hypothetical protein